MGVRACEAAYVCLGVFASECVCACVVDKDRSSERRKRKIET